LTAAKPGVVSAYVYARNTCRPGIERLCQSSRPDGMMLRFRVIAWIQYSRRTPPGWGWICGTS
jgi:hypothetical protein